MQREDGRGNVARVSVYVGMYRDNFFMRSSAVETNSSKKYLLLLRFISSTFIQIRRLNDLLYLTQLSPCIAPAISLDPWTSDGPDQEASNMTILKPLYVFIVCENIVGIASKILFFNYRTS